MPYPTAIAPPPAEAAFLVPEIALADFERTHSVRLSLVLQSGGARIRVVPQEALTDALRAEIGQYRDSLIHQLRDRAQRQPALPAPAVPDSGAGLFAAGSGTGTATSTQSENVGSASRAVAAPGNPAGCNQLQPKKEPDTPSPAATLPATPYREIWEAVSAVPPFIDGRCRSALHAIEQMSVHGLLPLPAQDGGREMLARLIGAATVLLDRGEPIPRIDEDACADLLAHLAGLLPEDLPFRCEADAGLWRAIRGDVLPASSPVPEEAVLRVYTTGYSAEHRARGSRSNCHKNEILREMVERLGADLYDIRHSAWSKAEMWQRPAMQAFFGGRYRHVGQLGNLNYDGKRGGEPIQIAALAAGLEIVLASERPVVLLCGCADAENCHRTIVAQELLTEADRRGLRVEVIEIECWEEF